MKTKVLERPLLLAQLLFKGENKKPWNKGHQRALQDSAGYKKKIMPMKTGQRILKHTIDNHDLCEKMISAIPYQVDAVNMAMSFHSCASRTG